MDDYRMAKAMVEREQITGMFKPVRCGCGQIYDVGKVEIAARYTDCTMWRTPCCNQLADDRCEYAPGWTSVIWYTVIDKSNTFPMDAYGLMWGEG